MIKATQVSSLFTGTTSRFSCFVPEVKCTFFVEKGKIQGDEAIVLIAMPGDCKQIEVTKCLLCWRYFIKKMQQEIDKLEKLTVCNHSHENASKIFEFRLIQLIVDFVQVVHRVGIVEKRTKKIAGELGALAEQTKLFVDEMEKIRERQHGDNNIFQSHSDALKELSKQVENLKYERGSFIYKMKYWLNLLPRQGLSSNPVIKDSRGASVITQASFLRGPAVSSGWVPIDNLQQHAEYGPYTRMWGGLLTSNKVLTLVVFLFLGYILFWMFWMTQASFRKV